MKEPTKAELWNRISDLKGENKYLKSGVEFYKKRAEAYEEAYHKADAQLQNILKDLNS
jgi:hypothetical protein